MDVRKQTFSWHLPRMLKALSECCCVALDMEFSGIAVRSSTGSPSGTCAGNPSMQQRYEEVKVAAETYQILQIGLTFVEEDTETGQYTLRPYNLYLSPVLDSKLEVERKWSYQSSAVEFLMSHGFRMEAPFTDGIPYISREEETIARTKLQTRESRRAQISDITVAEMDAEAIEFVNEARRRIDDCICNGQFAREGYINVPGPGEARPNQLLDPFTINGYKKRLIHQLVRTEYPDLVSLSRGTFVQIVAYNKEREDGLQNARMKGLEGRLLKQTGFGWLVEAMVGGDLSNFDPWWFAPVIEETTREIDSDCVRGYSTQLQQKLKSNRPPLIGHNLFVDLVYLYKSFIGELPARVEDFQQATHALFPFVIDTKYMATHNCGSLKGVSSLEDVNKALSRRKTPVIVTDPQHTKYLNGGSLHEAGYDSLLTSQIFLRISAELHERGLKSGAASPASYLAEGGIPQPWTEAVARKTSKLIDVDNSSNTAAFADLAHALKNHSQVDPSPLRPYSTRPRQRPVDWKEPTEVARIKSVFAHPNRFDLLTDQTEDEIAPSPSGVIRYDPALDTTAPLLDFSEEIAIQEKVDKGELIPRFDSEFWKTYGNKLRVFGTAEEICDLSGVLTGDK